jgi:hypothetical protein
MCLSNIKITSIDQSPGSSETIAATEDSAETESPDEGSEIETDWEEGEGGRDNIYREICSSYSAWQFSNAQVKKRKIERLVNEEQKPRLIDNLMEGFYAIFNRVVQSTGLVLEAMDRHHWGL